MTKTDFSILALGTPNLGELNQIYGAFKALEELTGNTYDYEKLFLLPLNVSSVHEQTEKIVASRFPDIDHFRTTVFQMLDNYFAKNTVVPKVFITAYTQAENKNAGKNVDTICQLIKEYYKIHNLGKIFTTVLTSRLHKYKYVDLINIPKHLLTFKARIRLLQNSELRKKSLITIGTINNLNQKYIKEKNKEFLNILKTLKQDPELVSHINKFEKFIASPKKLVFCLGGRVDGPEINFSVQFAKKLISDAEKMEKQGYGIVFLNGPRTPSDVCDIIYEQTLDNENIVFHNCKNIAQTEEDRDPSRWRLYTGRNEKAFSAMKKIGNIYPGILGFDNLLSVHTMDSYACCETANAAINTAICVQGMSVDPDIRYDCYNMVQLLCPKYAIDWDEFLYFSQNMKIEPKDLQPKILSSPLRVFAENIINRMS